MSTNPRLMLVTEPMDARKLRDIVKKAVKGGVDVVQIRDRVSDIFALRRVILCVQSDRPDAQIIVNGHPQLVADLGLAGVHIPESGSIAAARKIVGEEKLVGKSVHSLQAAEMAYKQGADYLLVGTIFASKSHPDDLPTGVELIKQICAKVSIPVIAIGGITPENCSDCTKAGAAGIAVLSGILHADDPGAAAKKYRSAFNNAQEG